MDSYDTLAARLVIAGIKGPVASPEELELVKRGIGGVILFARNVQHPAQVAELSKQLKSAAPGPLLISIDQEGGRVQRLKPPQWTPLPSMHRLGELDHHHEHAAGGETHAHHQPGKHHGTSGADIATALGALMAKELSACGIDQNFAPVVDVDTNPKNPVIGDRSIGGDETQVAKLGMALALAMEKGGVASCAKHYPGHGDTSQDSHHTLPRLSHDLARLWDCELVPFIAAARAGIASVMSAHVVFEGFDSLPATISPRAMRLLRKEIGFQGCIISDDLEMAAIAREVGVLDGAGLAIQAGCDAVLVCHTLALQHQVIDAIASAARSGPMPRGRLQQAAEHVAVMQKFARPAAVVDPHRAAAQCATAESLAFVQSLGVSIENAPHPSAMGKPLFESDRAPGVKRALASLVCVLALSAPAKVQARQSSSSAAKKKKEGAVDPSHWFATRQGLLRVYQDRGADKKSKSKSASSDGDADSAAPPAGASCEVVESTPRDGDADARTRESCTMISGRKSQGGTMLTYELRHGGIFLVELKSDTAADPVKLEHMLLPSPAKKGKSWSDKVGKTTVTRTVKSAGKSCKTAERKFGDCLVLAVVEREGKKTRRKYTETYAAGVGLVEDAHWELIDVKGL